MFLLLNAFFLTLLLFCAFVAFAQWRQSRESSILFYIGYLLATLGHYGRQFWLDGIPRFGFFEPIDWPFQWATPLSYTAFGCYFLFFEQLMDAQKTDLLLSKILKIAARGLFFGIAAHLMIQLVWGNSVADRGHRIFQAALFPIMVFVTFRGSRIMCFGYQKLVVAGCVALIFGFVGALVARAFKGHFFWIWDTFLCIPTHWGHFFLYHLKVGVAIDAILFSWALTLWQKKLLVEKGAASAPTIIQNIIAPMPAVSSDDPFFSNLEAILAARFSDEKLTVGQIAQALFKSEDVLLERIKKEKGMTTEQYLLRFRLDRALDFLAATEKPMAEITGLIGLRDAAHFSRVFKNQFGLTPSDYRRKQRENA